MTFTRLKENFEEVAEFNSYDGAARTFADDPEDVAVISCMAFCMSDNVNVLIGPVPDPWWDDWEEEWRKDDCGMPDFSDDVFSAYVEFVKGLHPLVRMSLESAPPTKDNPFVHINTGRRYINYCFTVLWRQLWNSPRFVYLAKYLHERGFSTWEIIIIATATIDLWHDHGEFILSNITPFDSTLMDKVALLDTNPEHPNAGTHLQSVLRAKNRDEGISLGMGSITMEVYKDIKMWRKFVRQFYTI